MVSNGGVASAHVKLKTYDVAKVDRDRSQRLRALDVDLDLRVVHSDRRIDCHGGRFLR